MELSLLGDHELEEHEGHDDHKNDHDNHEIKDEVHH
jgi:hypothetical protein